VPRKSSPTPTKEEWREVVGLGQPVPLVYPAELLATFWFPIGPTERGYFMRYEDTRALVAGTINRARETHGELFRTFEFDLWIGQTCLAGVYQDEMFVTAAASGGELPMAILREAVAGRATREEAGRNPVADGGFPEVRVSGGTLAGKWSLDRDLCLKLSRSYRAAHRLAARSRDPYTQMASGASEPLHFTWHLAESQLGSAIEVIPSEELRRDHVPIDPADRHALVAFGLTHDAFSPHETADGFWGLAEEVQGALSQGEDLADLPLDTLRTWLLGEALRARDGEAYEEEAVGEVLAAIRRAIRESEPVPDPQHLCGIPSSTARWSPTIEEFALTFNAYTYWGSFARCARVAAEVRDGWASHERLPRSLPWVRTALFFEQRSARHVGTPPTRSNMKYIRALVEAIRRLASAGGRVRRQHQSSSRRRAAGRRK
jgi:hypothetical protein